jgi:hypothetical protein
MRNHFILITLFIVLFPSVTNAQAKWEDISGKAIHLTNLEKAVGPFLQKCGNTNSRPDLHCRAIREYMQRRTTRKIFTAFSDNGALSFGNYDNAKFEYPIKILGCITCNKPASFDPLLFKKNKFYIASKTEPVKSKTGLKWSELSKFTMPVDPRKLGDFLKNTKPFLKVQVLFRVTKGKIFNPKLGHQGITLHTGGFRVVNVCTGEILYSNPPSRGKGPIFKAGCKSTKKVVKDPSKNLPKKLSNSSILKVIKSIRKKIKSCYEIFQIPGKAKVSVKVSGKTGKVIYTKVKGSFSGTPTATCILKYVKGLVFSKFKNKKQSFRYTFNLP